MFEKIVLFFIFGKSIKLNNDLLSIDFVTRVNKQFINKKVQKMSKKNNCFHKLLREYRLLIKL